MDIVSSLMIGNGINNIIKAIYESSKNDDWNTHKLMEDNARNTDRLIDVIENVLGGKAMIDALSEKNAELESDLSMERHYAQEAKEAYEAKIKELESDVGMERHYLEQSMQEVAVLKARIAQLENELAAEADYAQEAIKAMTIRDGIAAIDAALKQ